MSTEDTAVAMDTQNPPITPRDGEVKTSAGHGQCYVAVDTEGLGDNMWEYPTVAVAFAVVNHEGKQLYTWQGYAPYEVSEKTIEPRCYKEFWSNPKKCQPEVFKALQDKCRAALEACVKSLEVDESSVQKAYAKGLELDVSTLQKVLVDQHLDAKEVYKCAGSMLFWHSVSNAIDEIYDLFDSEEHPLIWVGDCLDYDYGRLEAYLARYTKRPLGLRYNLKNPGQRHSIEDCDSGREVLKQLCPEAYSDYKNDVQNSGVKHSHDCLDDAIGIATKYALFLKHVQIAADMLRY